MRSPDLGHVGEAGEAEVVALRFEEAARAAVIPEWACLAPLCVRATCGA
jgi:hypothetical protein